MPIKTVECVCVYKTYVTDIVYVGKLWWNTVRASSC